MKQVAIWIDKKNAKIVSIKDGKLQVSTIASKVENFHVRGGSGSALKGGPQDVVQDSKYLEREKHQLTNFFQTIVPHISDADVMVILGPAQTGKKLQTQLSEKYPLLNKKIISLEKADSMTDKELIAWFKNYYVLKNDEFI